MKKGLTLLIKTGLTCGLLLTVLSASPVIAASPADLPQTQVSEKKSNASSAGSGSAAHTANARRQMLDTLSLLTGISWEELAAIDQYDRTISAAKRRKDTPPHLGFWYAPQEWAGFLNPDPEDNSPLTIAIFGGKGRDGDGDGKADRNNDHDVLRVVAEELDAGIRARGAFQNWLRERYGSDRSLTRIGQFAAIYRAFGRIDLHDHAFPLPLRSHYTYRDTWGASRGWGGRRIHEGTDLFAGYGVPVRSTCYGMVEVKGWNPYGGWRVGIRDLDNRYHYYAHLSGFAKNLKAGDIVRPGQVIGWVGSSGYGKPGTSGKFPPHLHYGLYRDNGTREWSFDPYPHLRKWEREERRQSRNK